MGERTLRPTIMKIMIVKRMIVMTVMRMIMMVMVMVMMMMVMVIVMVMVVAMVAHCDIVSVDDREDNVDEPIFIAGYFLK